jgi:hypothetical protein
VENKHLAPGNRVAENERLLLFVRFPGFLGGTLRAENYSGVRPSSILENCVCFVWAGE